MRAWVVAMVLAASARAEQWADEPAVSAPVESPRPPPRVGFLVGAHVGLPPNLTHAPMLGGRAGLRLALARHASIAILTDWSFVEIDLGDAKGTLQTFHLVSGLALFEFFSRSAFEHVLVPEVSVGALAGFGAELGVPTDKPLLGGQVGLHFGFTRLQPTGWWFPFFLEVILSFDGKSASARLITGIAL